MRGLKWVLPALLVLVVVTVVPIGRAVWTSLHRSTATGPSQMVGLDNYGNVLSSRDWWLAVATTLVVVAGVVAVQVLLGLVFGGALHRLARGWPLARVVILLPLTVLSIVGVVIWRDAARTGFLQQWFDLDGENSLVAVCLSEVWRGTGLVIVVVAIALARVPGPLMTSAIADGATFFQRWRRVVLPSMGPALAAIVMFRVLDTYRVLDGPLVVERDTANVLMWNTQFSDFELGLGAAMSIVLLLLGVVLTAIVFPLVRVRRVL